MLRHTSLPSHASTKLVHQLIPNIIIIISGPNTRRRLRLAISLISLPQYTVCVWHTPTARSPNLLIWPRAQPPPKNINKGPPFLFFKRRCVFEFFRAAFGDANSLNGFELTKKKGLQVRDLDGVVIHSSDHRYQTAGPDRLIWEIGILDGAKKRDSD